MSFFDRLKEGLSKTRDSFAGAVDNIIYGRAKIDDETFEDLEASLVMADIGYETSMEIIDELRDKVADEHIRDGEGVKSALRYVMTEKILKNSEDDSILNYDKPIILLIIGVNGVGKTTTIGKMAKFLKEEGKSVLLCAADTFRAAAIEQLDTWATRSEVEIIKHEEGADPASVVYDGIHAAKSRGNDILIIDTAGRLHNKKNLMNELEKINRIIDREYPEAHKESLLVLDAGTGQNALLQAKAFNEVTKLTGLILTKLDGTGKGGVIYPLQNELKLPVKWIGVGEGIDDLRPFVAEDFVGAIFN